MLDTTVTLLSAWARNVDNGWNASTAVIPRFKFGVAPPEQWPAPPVIAIVDDQMDPGVAKELAPSELPCIMIWGDSDAETRYKDRPAREVAIAAAFCTNEDMDPLEAERLCGFYMRGGRLSYFRYNRQGLSRDYRKLNGVLVMEVSKCTEQRITAAVGRYKMWGFLDLRVIVVDDLQ